MNIPIKGHVTEAYSTDANLLGLTHEGEHSKSSWMQQADFVAPAMGVWPELSARSCTRSSSCRLGADRPVTVKLGERLTLPMLFHHLNALWRNAMASGSPAIIWSRTALSA